LLGARPAPQAGPPAYAATVSVSASGNAVGAIGGQFIGLSFESGTLNSGRFTTKSNLPQLLSNLGSGVMRFGGDTVDTNFTGMAPQPLSALAGLATAAGWSVLYSENLGNFKFTQVSADASAVRAALGASLLAIGCGNEPDEYGGNGVRPPHFPIATYLAQVGACYHAIRVGAPDVPLAGPDTASFNTWLASYLGRAKHTISWIGQHYYPLGCARPVTDPGAWAGTLLSPGLADAEAARLTGYAKLATAAHLPLLLTETNSACHGGIAGLSDSYASALWAIDFLLTGAEHGVHGMEFHGGLNNLCTGYTVLCQVSAGTYAAQPIYYGLLFTHLLGTGSLRPVAIAATSRLANLTAFALKPGGGGSPTGASLRLMVENLSSAQASVTLRPAGYTGAGTVLRLTGPGLLATSGVLIQGQSVRADGGFTGNQPAAIECTRAGCPLSLAPYSAALVTLG
jgi:hypothetical protein